MKIGMKKNSSNSCRCTDCYCTCGLRTKENRKGCGLKLWRYISVKDRCDIYILGGHRIYTDRIL